MKDIDSKKLETLYKLMVESPVAPVKEPSAPPQKTPTQPNRPNPSKNPFGPQPGKREHTKPKGVANTARKFLGLIKKSLGK